MMNKIISFLGIVLILLFGRPFLLPIVTAVFLWYLTLAISIYYKKIVRIDWVSKILAGLTLVGIGYLFVTQIRPMFADLYTKMPEITVGIEKTLHSLSAWLGMDISFSSMNMPSFHEIMTSVGTSLASVSATFGTILIYMLFIFIEQGTFAEKLRKIFPEKRQFTKMNFIIKSIDAHMRKYLFIKTWISIGSAVCFYIFLIALGVEFAGVWAFLTFIMNYIPTFGSIVSTILPMIYTFATTGAVHVPILIGVVSVIINLILGNILEPKLTGKSLNLSVLAILMNLVMWGFLWGPLGMFFSVPILATIFVVSAQFDKTRWIAVLLSSDGHIPDKNEED